MEMARPLLGKEGIQPEAEKFLQAVETVRERSRTLMELVESVRFYFVDRVTYEPKAARKFLKAPMIPVFEKVMACLGRLDSFDKPLVEGCFTEITQALDIKLGKVAQPVRVALTGKTVSPGLFEVMEVLGKKETLERLRNAIVFIKESPANDVFPA
jgi:glutamyl-tRNA synthetase